MARREVQCPHCGESFRAGRLSCPHCGADSETGWMPPEDQELAAVDTSFTHLEAGDYELFLESEGLRPDSEPAASPVMIATGAIPWVPILLILTLAAAALYLSM